MHFTMHTEKNLHRCEWDTQDRYMITDAVRSVLTAHLDTIQKYTENAEDLTSIQVTILHCIITEI